MQRACCKEGKQTLLSEESREAEVMSFTPLLPGTASVMFCSTIIYQQTLAKRRFFQLLTNMWNESPSASMVFLPHKGGFVAFFYCEMLHIDFLHVDFLSFFLSWGTFTSFLLTHRPQSDKLLWYIPVGAGGDPHPPDTLGLVLPICRSNWNTWTINFFSSPPRLWKEKAHILIKAWHHRSACICFIPGDYRRVAGCSLVSFRFQLLLHERHEAVHIKCVAT